ncbi:biotin--[acetyl-CoA-carboxylase] ligase [uncultured Gemmiger sp.]|mgnify:FL=1|uniref:biotin--[acetyl-CoA-carboxylase] ligase n=1 Tax=uncultured Gemmiger sp. TaxID=1623490 RepID=UPI0025D5D998|nr:biotin--[acetyl-CoA-carboxylase] ligase [uncultured Gemmiger sp.]
MVRQQVLAALDAARGRYISGQELAQQLGVSRTAVWKAVTALRADGTPIEAVTNRGYVLHKDTDLLDADAVCALLKGAAAGLQVEVVQRLPGTNAALRRQAADGEPEGRVLIAQAQSAGRGRQGRSFYSPPGGLYMSLLLRPDMAARQAVQITAMAAVAAARAIRTVCGVQVEIKWVNDLLYGGKKVCGILTEASLDLESGMLDYAVLGLGINLVTPLQGWPQELSGVAGALYETTPPGGTRAALAAAVLNEFWALYTARDHGNFLEEYRRLQILPGKQIEVVRPGCEVRSALALGVDEECRLRVRFEGETAVTALSSGEARVREAE